MTTSTNAIPAEESELLNQLWLAEKTNHDPAKALADQAAQTRARAWLQRILADIRALEAHTKWLGEVCQTTFRPALPRRVCDGFEPPQPEPDTRIPYRDLLPKACATQIAKDGVDFLVPDMVARLLLNPYALWDVEDLISMEWSDYWDPLLHKVGEELMEEWGIDPTAIPGVDPELVKAKLAQRT
jgi:hypothetical protein